VRWFLLWLLSTAGVLIVAACAALLLVRHRLDRRNRVHPEVPTDAPLTWLVDPRSPARLHRRLTGVGRSATLVADHHRIPRRRLRRPPEQPHLVDVAEDLAAQAARLDHEVARIARLAPGARREPLAALHGRVAALEQAALRLGEISVEVRTPRTLAAHDAALIDIAGQLERLAEAHAALAAIDEDAGLRAAPGAAG
jgi:hypothetical protein